MTATVQKLRLIRWITELEDTSMLNVLDALQERGVVSEDWWDTISDAERTSIEIGLAQAEAGLTVPHEEVRKIYAQWLTK
jgi:predicted transcriptional regulator